MSRDGTDLLTLANALSVFSRRGGPEDNGTPFFGARVPFSVTQRPKNGTRIEIARRCSEQMFRFVAHVRRQTARMR